MRDRRESDGWGWRRSRKTYYLPRSRASTGILRCSTVAMRGSFFLYPDPYAHTDTDMYAHLQEGGRAG